MNEPRPPLSRRKAVWMGLAFLAAGIYPLAVAIGLAHPTPGTVYAPLWVVGLAGACFVLAGAVLVVPREDVRLRGLVAGLVVTCLAAVLDWIAFGPGERHFGGSIAFGGAAMRSASSEPSGRIAFGIAAVVLDAFAAWGWYRWLRSR